MKLGTRGKYAIVALIDIATRTDNQWVRIIEISLRQDITVNYLEQLFSKLKRSNIIISERGPNGGYRLARNACDIRICDILLAVEENVNAMHSGRGAKGAVSGSRAQSMANRLWEGLSSHVYVFLHNTTLQDIVDNALEPCPALLEFSSNDCLNSRPMADADNPY